MFIRDIQIFISFVKFYLCFIYYSNKIITQLILMLKITRLLEELINVGGIKLNRKEKNKQFENLSFVTMKKLNFFTFNTKKVFYCLWQDVIKVFIFQYFDLESYI